VVSHWSWGAEKSARTVLLVSTPILYGDRFSGDDRFQLVGPLQFLIRRLQEVNRAGLMPYVVDSPGGGWWPLPLRNFATGQGHDQFRYRPHLCG